MKIKAQQVETVIETELLIKKTQLVNKAKLQSVLGEVRRRTHLDFDNEHDLREIVEILGKDRYSKNQQDTDLLRMAFIRINFFQDLERQMTSEFVLPLYKELFYEKMASRQVVFNLGETGRKFYIILKGSVWVLVKKRGLQDGTLPTKEEMKAEEEEKRQIVVIKQRKRKTNIQEGSVATNNNLFVTQIKGKRLSQVIEEKLIPEDDLCLTDAQYIEKNFPYFQQVGTMVAGDSFGEIALSKQIPRTATIVCNEQTHFVSLTREAFNKLLSEYYQILQQVNVKLLQQVSMFSDWNEAMLNQLYYHFTFKKFTMNQTIYKENDESDEIYLVKEGEVEISRMLSIKTKEPTESEKLLANFVSQSDRYSSKTKRIKQALITVGQVFGQEEVLEGCKRKSMAVCVSDNIQLFVLDRQRFLSYCTRGHALDKIRESSYRKKQWRSLNANTSTQLEIPLIETNFEDGQFKNYLLNKRMDSQDKSINMGSDHTLQSRRVSNFVVPKIVNIIDRISDKTNITASKLLQEKTHMNSAVENFSFNYDSIVRTMKPHKVMTLNSGFFDLDMAKISTNQLSAKNLPKVEPKRLTQSTDRLIKHLRLPSVLKYIDLQAKNKIEDEVDTWRKVIKARTQISQVK